MSNKYYNRSKATGMCVSHPNEKALPGKTWCSVCSDRSRKWHDNNALRGMCRNHSTVVQEAGTTLCKRCLMNNRLRLLRRGGLPDSEIEKARKAWESFDGVCQCCGTTDPGLTRQWCSDHDHVLKIFRGIICHSCNHVLGRVRDRADHLKRLIQYVERTRNVL